MVKFFGRTTKTATTTRKTESKTASAAKTASSTSAAPEPSAPSTSTTSRASTSTRAAASTATANGDKPSTTTRRGRPPRKDWAAEAAATPTSAPSPRPSSLATAPGDDDAAGTPATKRRRGTRGGRGRKKPGTVAATEVSENGAEPADLSSSTIRRDSRQKPAAPPATMEEALAQQAAALQRFTAEMTTSIQRLQGAIEDLRDRADNRGPSTSNPRVAIFVDVPNLIYAAERRKVNLDFGKILEHFTRGRELVRASAYAPITDDPQAKFENQRFVQSFVGQPYRIITKPLKRFADGSMKANFDIELAIDILTMSDRLDIVVLMSGDGDFRRVVELIGSRGVRVEVVAFAETAAAELKSVADLYVDLGAHVDKFKVSK